MTESGAAATREAIIALGASEEALYRLLKVRRSSDRLRRRGAPTKNLAQSASLDSEDKDAHQSLGSNTWWLPCEPQFTVALRRFDFHRVLAAPHPMRCCDDECTRNQHYSLSEFAEL